MTEEPASGHSWSTERQLWWRDFDALGHLTAGSYSLIYHDVIADFVTEAWGSVDASYVAARLALEYLHEVRPDDSPVRVYVEVQRVGRAGFDVTMRLETAARRTCSRAEASFSAWDMERRRARPMTADEREGLLALGCGRQE